MKPRLCHYCGKPVLVSKHDHDHRILISPNNQVAADLIWHLECNPFKTRLVVDNHPPQSPQSPQTSS